MTLVSSEKPKYERYTEVTNVKIEEKSKTSSGRIFIVDDEESVLNSLQLILEHAGYEVEKTTAAPHALELVQQSDFDIIILDLQMPQLDGLSMLRAFKESGVQANVIMMSAYGNSEIALEAIKLGAYDYISKPFNADEILLTIKKAEERERLRRENEILRGQVSSRYSFSNIIAKSPNMNEVFETIRKIADYKTTVMIYGESGTGKELVARAIHHNSKRRNRRFIAINCGAIPENLLESELFGHRRGAFTDATRDKKGLFEEANGGTVLLDEVGELPLHLQVKLLRVLQEEEIRPVGDGRVIPIDVRIIAATLRDLEQDVLEGRFRDDLFYRLNVISLRIPTLRERREDIPVLITHFLRKNQERMGLAVTGVQRDALSMLMEHDWPGNIRELENCIERAMILTDGSEITVESLPRAVRAGAEQSKDSEAELSDDELSIKVHTRTIEERLIRKALQKTAGNRTHAAKLLEISHRTLLYKLKDFGLAPADEE